MADDSASSQGASVGQEPHLGQGTGMEAERTLVYIEFPRSDKQGGGEDVINEDEVTVRSTL